MIIATFADGKIQIDDTGTLRGGKLAVYADGSLQLGEALGIDQNGVMTLDGAEFRIKNGYNLIFSDGGSPVIPSANGTLFKLLVSDSGVLSTEPL